MWDVFTAVFGGGLLTAIVGLSIYAKQKGLG